MIEKDYKAFKMTPFGLIKGFFACHTFYLVLLYRIGNFFYRHKIPYVPDLFKALQLLIFSAEVSPYAQIGGGLRIYHSVGIVIGHACEIGENVEIFQNVTMGGNDKEIDGRTMPKIGNNVSVFSGAAVLGPVVIGDNVSIGANSIVTKDVPCNVVVAGIPAKMIKEITIARAIRNS